MIRDLPFSYKTANEFDRKHGVPIGKDWNSTKMFRDKIKPEILTTPGALI